MRRTLCLLLLTAMASMLWAALAPAGTPAPNLVGNGGFEVEGPTRGVPEHFRAAAEYRLTEDHCATGRRAITFASAGPLKWRYLSQDVIAEPNHRYTLRIKALNRDVEDLWLVWSERPGIGLWRRERVQIRPCTEWTEYRFNFTTGVDHEISVGVGVTGSHRGPATAYLDDLRLGECEPEPISDGPPPKAMGFEPRPSQRLRSSPTGGETVALNPPALKWTDQGYEHYSVQWSRDSSFVTAETASDIVLRLHTPDRALEPGVWYWRHAGHSAEFTTLWSAPKKFVIPKEAPRIPVPSEREILARIPRSHPRAFFTGRALEAARRYAEGPGKAAFESITATAERNLNKPLPDDPKRVDKSSWSPKQVGKYLSVHQTASRVCSRAAGASFAYLMSGR